MKTPLGSWLRDLFQAEVVWETQIAPRFNIAPTQSILIASLVGVSEPRVELSFAKWGLIPRWSDDAKIGSKMINARSETVLEKVSFRELMKVRRCVVLADGYYEWMTKKDKTKIPFWIHRATEEPFAMAALWDANTKVVKDQTVITATIVTTSSNDDLKPIHDRMPVIFPTNHAMRSWMDGENVDAAEAVTLCQPTADNFMQVRPVGKKVGNVQFDCPECIVPTAELFQ